MSKILCWEIAKLFKAILSDANTDLFLLADSDNIHGISRL